MSAPRCAIAVMIKSPEPGLVNERLTTALTPHEAAELYKCFIKDTFSRLEGIEGVDVFAACAPKEGHIEVAGLVHPSITVFTQEGDDVGERMANVFNRLFKLDYNKVALIGSDSPDIPLEHIKDAFSMLYGREAKKAVVGQSKDGGYYLIALDRPMDFLFMNIPWATDGVFEATLKAAGKYAVTVNLVPEWHKIDTPDDFSLLLENREAKESIRYLRSKGFLK